MKYTNNFGFPPFVVDWLKFDEYDFDPEVYSATRLLRPTRMIVLEKRHNNELEIDITEVVASRYGTALHDSIEKLKFKNALQEHRFFCEVDGQMISGKPDILEERFWKKGYKPVTKLKKGKEYNLWDIKSTSVWTFIYGSRDVDHLKQLSQYRYMVMHDKENEGLLVSRDAKIIYMFTDHSRSKARQGGDYPKHRIAIKDVKLMTTEETEVFIRGKLGHINHFMDTPEQELPECTREDLWQGDDKWAVIKRGRKSAVKVYDNEEDASDRVVQEGENIHWVEKRPGKVNRCNYCNVSPWCSQFKMLKEEGIIAE